MTAATVRRPNNCSSLSLAWWLAWWLMQRLQALQVSWWEVYATSLAIGFFLVLFFPLSDCSENNYTFSRGIFVLYCVLKCGCKWNKSFWDNLNICNIKSLKLGYFTFLVRFWWKKLLLSLDDLIRIYIRLNCNASKLCLYYDAWLRNAEYLTSHANKFYFIYLFNNRSKNIFFGL